MIYDRLLQERTELLAREQELDALKRNKELALKEVIDLLQKENMFSEKDTQEIINALRNGTIFSLREELLGKLGLSFDMQDQVSEIDLRQFNTPENKEKQEVSFETKEAVLNVIEITLEEKEQELHRESYTPEEELKAGITAVDTIDQKLDKLKNHKTLYSGYF